MVQIIIKVLHLILLLFIVLSPFSNQPIILKYHKDIIIFLLVKWLILNKCTLVKVESKLRQLKKREDGYIYQFLQPIISLKDHRCRWLIFGITIFLGFLSYSKLSYLVN